MKKIITLLMIIVITKISFGQHLKIWQMPGLQDSLTAKMNIKDSANVWATQHFVLKNLVPGDAGSIHDSLASRDDTLLNHLNYQQWLNSMRQSDSISFQNNKVNNSDSTVKFFTPTQALQKINYADTVGKVATQYRLSFKSQGKQGTLSLSNITGNLRGLNATDFQFERDSANQVSSGRASFTSGGYNINQGDYSFATGSRNYLLPDSNTGRTSAWSGVFGSGNRVNSYNAFSYGGKNHVDGLFASAGNNGNVASGNDSHAEGNLNTTGRRFYAIENHGTELYNSTTTPYVTIADSEGNLTYYFPSINRYPAGYDSSNGLRWAMHNYCLLRQGGEYLVDRFKILGSVYTPGNGTKIYYDNGNTEAYSGNIGWIFTSYSPLLPDTIGNQNIYMGNGQHAEGRYTQASGYASHSEGSWTRAWYNYSHAEGDHTAAMDLGGHSEGGYTKAYWYAHSEGYGTIASGNFSHAQNCYSIGSGIYSDASGYQTLSSGLASHTEGGYTVADTSYAHSEGASDTASGYASHAEGIGSVTIGDGSHSEGYFTKTIGNYSHAQNDSSIATGLYSDAIGLSSEAHREGQSSLADGRFAINGDAQNSEIVRKLQAPHNSGWIALRIMDTEGGKTYMCRTKLVGRQYGGSAGRIGESICYEFRWGLQRGHNIGISPSDVDTTTDEIVVTDTLTRFAKVNFSFSGNSIGGLYNYLTYYIIVVDGNHIKLASTLSNAQNGIAIDLTSQGSGTITMSEWNIWFTAANDRYLMGRNISDGGDGLTTGLMATITTSYANNFNVVVEIDNQINRDVRWVATTQFTEVGTNDIQ